MYLHMGQELVVRQKNIIGVFDIENTTISGTTRHFLQQAEKSGEIQYVTYDLPKSFTVCSPPKGVGKQTVIISPIAPRTLKKRANEV